MQVITSEKWLAAVSGGDDPSPADVGNTASGGSSGGATMNSVCYTPTDASCNTVASQVAAQTAASAQAAALVAAAQPSVASSLATGVTTAAAGCMGGVSTAGNVAKLAGLTPLGQVGNLVACSAGALAAAIVKVN